MSETISVFTAGSQGCASSGQRLQMLLSILQCIGQPPQRRIIAFNVNSVKVGNRRERQRSRERRQILMGK